MPVETANEPPFGHVKHQMNKLMEQMQKGFYTFSPGETWTPNVNLYENDASYAANSRGDWPTGEAYCRRSLAIAEEIQHYGGATLALHNLAVALYAQGGLTALEGEASTQLPAASTMWQSFSGKPTSGMSLS